MNASQSSPAAARLILAADKAADLMTKSPVMIRADSAIRTAAAVLIAEEISGAPVVDAANRVIGVISHTDIVRYDSEGPPPSGHDTGYYHDLQLRCPPALRDMIYGSQAESVRVADVMSTVIIKVSTQDSAIAVVAEFLALKIHRLFVVDESEKLVGVISALDVLRHLKRQSAD
jgi:predicted transcriptional regulator